MSHSSAQQQDDQSDAEWLDTRPKPKEAAFVLTPRGAAWSRRWRITIGIFHALSGICIGLYTVSNAILYFGQMQEFEAAGGTVPATTLVAAIAIVGAFALVTVMSPVVGIWNIVACYGMAKGPLVAAMVLAAAILALLMFLVGDSQGDAFHITGYVIYGLPIVGSTAVLALDRIPAEAVDVLGWASRD